MKTNLRGLLATMFATGLLAACSSDGGTPTPTPDAGTGSDIGTSDIGTADVPRTDVPRADVPRVDAGNPVAAVCAAAVDLSSMMPGSDGALHVTGDNSDAPAVQVGNLGLAGMGGCLGTMGGEGSKGGAEVYRYTMRSAGLLTVSTANAGTDSALDTVVAILPTCSATATPLACNDDIGQGNLRSTARTTMALTAGQSVFIVVGGWGTTPKSAASGPYELTIREAAPIAIGMPCAAGAVCASGSICVGATAMNSGTCSADGSAPGAACRSAAPFCDTAFACSVATPSMAARGICRRTVALGEACGATAVCGSMGFCPNFTTTPAASGDAGVTVDGGAPAAGRYCAAPVAETEPNNTPAAPQAAVTSTTVFRGALATGADVDCYAVTVPTGTTLYAETSGADGTCSLGMGEDTIVNIYRQGDATAIATNDDIAMGNVCSRISGSAAVTRVAAGTYSVCVSSFLNMGEGTPIPVYYLTLGVTN